MMKKPILITLISIFPLSFLSAQMLERKTLDWEQRTINIGAILEESTAISVSYFASNPHPDSIWINDVITECGCTAVSFDQRPILQDSLAEMVISYSPEQRGGTFSKLIIVRTNEDIYGDTLFLEGINMPMPENPELAFTQRQGPLGFRLPAVNFGQVLTNEPKIRFVEVYNFGQDTLRLEDFNWELPEYVKIENPHALLTPEGRALMAIHYDGSVKADLGYFEESISAENEQGQTLNLNLMVSILEYFPPTPRSMEFVVPRLGILEPEIDLKEVSANRKVNKEITLSNLGKETLEIRKVSTNCDCLEANVVQMEIPGGGSTTLKFTFDPKGRRGIDHKHLTIFSNDPLNPTRTIVIKSTVK